MNVRTSIGLAAVAAFAGLAPAQQVMIQKRVMLAEPTQPSTTKPPSTEFKPDTNTSPDPKTLDVPADVLKQTADLAKKLGSITYRDRELASRELTKFGRMALPALLEAATSDNPEVVERAEALIPKAQTLDMKARVACFLADSEGKYQHTLAGWNKFQATAGNSKASRELFAEALKNKKTHQMLLAAEGNPEEASTVLSAFVSAMQGYNRWGGNYEQPTTPKTADMVVALFLESQYTDKEVVVSMPFAWGGGWYSVAQHMYNTSDFQNAIRQSPSGKYAEPIRKVTQKWMDTRETANGCNQAWSFAQQMLGSKPALKYAARVLAAESSQNTQYMKQNILQQMGQNNAKEFVPEIAKCFDDNLLLWSAQNGGTPNHDIQLRDFALAVALQLTDQNPKDYGFDSTQPTSKTKNYNYTTFYFKDERDEKDRGVVGPNGVAVARAAVRGGRAVAVVEEKDAKKDEKDKKEEPKKDEKDKKLSGDDKRKIAFKKWADWATTNIVDGKVKEQPKAEEPKANGGKKEEPKKDEVKKDASAEAALKDAAAKKEAVKKEAEEKKEEPKKEQPMPIKR